MGKTGRPTSRPTLALLTDSSHLGPLWFSQRDATERPMSDFVKLTTPNRNTPVYVNLDNVTRIVPSEGSEPSPGAWVYFGENDRSLRVIETPEAIMISARVRIVGSP
jgi:hypothetical protein